MMHAISRFLMLMVLVAAGIFVDEAKLQSQPAAQPTTRLLTVHQQQYGLGVLSGAIYIQNARRVITWSPVGCYLWDPETGEVIRSFSEPGFAVESMAVSHNGAWLAMGDRFGGRLLIWEVETGVRLSDWKPGPEWADSIQAIGFTQDDQEVAVATDSYLVLMDPFTGIKRKELWNTDAVTGQPYDVVDLAYSPDDLKLATVDQVGKLAVWDLQTEMRTELADETGFHLNGNVRYSSNGSLLLMSLQWMNVAKLFDADTGNFLRSFNHGTSIEDVCFSPDDSSVITAAYPIQVWRTQTGGLKRTIDVHEHRVLTARFSPDGQRILTASMDQRSLILDESNGAVLQTLEGHQSYIRDIAASPENSYVLSASTSFDVLHPVRMYDYQSGLYLNTPFEDVMRIAVSPDGKTIAVEKNYGPIEMWDFPTAAKTREFLPMVSPISFLNFSSEGNWLLIGGAAAVQSTSGTQTGRVEIWNAETLLLSGAYEMEGSISSVALSPDQTRMVVGTGIFAGGVAYLWNLSDSTPFRVLHGHAQNAYALFHPDGNSVITIGESSSIRWDVTTGNQLRVLPTQATHGAISPDGTLLCVDRWYDAEVWRLADGFKLATLTGHADEVEKIQFAAGGRNILTGSYDGTVRLWELYPPQALIIAGGGEFSGNAIGVQTERLAVMNYDMLRKRGYRAEDILFLSAFGEIDADGDGINDVDAPATLENLRAAMGTGN